MLRTRVIPAAIPVANVLEATIKLRTNFFHSSTASRIIPLPHSPLDFLIIVSSYPLLAPATPNSFLPLAVHPFLWTRATRWKRSRWLGQLAATYGHCKDSHRTYRRDTRVSRSSTVSRCRIGRIAMCDGCVGDISVPTRPASHRSRRDINTMHEKTHMCVRAACHALFLGRSAAWTLR